MTCPPTPKTIVHHPYNTNPPPSPLPTKRHNPTTNDDDNTITQHQWPPRGHRPPTLPGGDDHAIIKSAARSSPHRVHPCRPRMLRELPSGQSIRPRGHVHEPASRPPRRRSRRHHPQRNSPPTNNSNCSDRHGTPSTTCDRQHRVSKSSSVATKTRWRHTSIR